MVPPTIFGPCVEYPPFNCPEPRGGAVGGVGHFSKKKTHFRAPPPPPPPSDKGVVFRWRCRGYQWELGSSDHGKRNPMSTRNALAPNEGCMQTGTISWVRNIQKFFRPSFGRLVIYKSFTACLAMNNFLCCYVCALPPTDTHRTQSPPQNQ